MKIDDANEQVYDYDSVYQLTFVDYNDGNDMSFYYDALGNRWQTINGGTVNYLTNSLNQYTSVGGTSYTYDDNGNLAYDGILRYYYDCENRLIDVNDANDNPVASYTYDYSGRRIARTIYGSPDVTIKYAYDGARIIAEYDANNTLLRKFIYGPGIDEPICVVDVADGNAVYYYHFDGLGSVVALSDVNNLPVERYAYDVFGRPTIRDVNGVEIAESAFTNPYLFTGRAWDPETALYYYRARYYDYFTGRFLQADPIGYGDGMNLYAYCNNNAVNHKDPMGLISGDSGSVLLVTTQSGRETTYDLNSATDMVMVMIEAKVSGDRITEFEYIGHADESGGGLLIGQKGKASSGIWNFEPSPTSEFPAADNYHIDSLRDLITDAFDPQALIELAGCGTAYPGSGGSIAEDFKEILPDASVWGYTDTASIHDFFPWIHKPKKEKGSKFAEVGTDGKNCKK